MVQLSLLVGACWLLACLALVVLCGAAGRRPRHGGYMVLPPASNGSSPPMGGARPTSTGCRPVGLRLAGPAGQAPHHPPSSDTERGFSTDGRSPSTATAGYPGPPDATAGSDPIGAHDTCRPYSEMHEGRDWFYVRCACGAVGPGCGRPGLWPRCIRHHAPARPQRSPRKITRPGD